jgi:hypothetical protein
MKTLDSLCRLLVRFRYPFSVPADIASALGIHTSHFITFNKLISYLTNPACKPATLSKYMPRSQAERAFTTALRKERFQSDSLFSYHINGNWLEFVLHFDDQARLRRLYIFHKDFKEKHEIPIN